MAGADKSRQVDNSADLIIGFKLVRERFTSKVTLASDNRIDVVSDGPFRYLDNHWIPVPSQWMRNRFFCRFQFRNQMLQGWSGWSSTRRYNVWSTPLNSAPKFFGTAAMLAAPDPAD